LLQERQK